MKDSDVSNTVKITCPSLPPAVSLNQQPSYKKGSVTIAWERPPGAESTPFGEEVIYYRYDHAVIHSELSINNPYSAEFLKIY